MLRLAIPLLSLIIPVAGLGKSRAFDYLLCDQFPDMYGFVPDGETDDLMCWLKGSNQGRQMLLIYGLDSSDDADPPFVSTLKLRKKKTDHHTGYTEGFITTSKEGFYYRGRQWSNGTHYMTGDKNHGLKLTLMQKEPLWQEWVDLTRVEELSPDDKLVHEVSTYVDRKNGMKVTAGFVDEESRYVFYLIKKNGRGQWGHSLRMKTDGFLLTSPVDDFKGTFYKVMVGQKRYVIMLGEFTEGKKKSLKMLVPLRSETL
ncbi:hypothetical protein FOL46_006712 [Perkinsus olseni]|uniref:Uncharacterized protein n=1 Tax=Perkinsus olseni TaxID=32597 RepID=A0A7J6LIN1_PEROL|nr:hypothetical protein FOL46_006712 [Perkinsus olseni]